MGVCSETKPTLLAGYIITIVAFVIHLIGFATPYWNSYEKTIVLFGKSFAIEGYFGLWRYCQSYAGTLTCGRYFVEVNVNVSISKLANTTLF
jgi:hypothetical protein